MEKWEIEFDKEFPEFGYPRGTRNDRMKGFIAEQISKAKEEGVRDN